MKFERKVICDSSTIRDLRRRNRRHSLFLVIVAYTAFGVVLLAGYWLALFYLTAR